MAKFLGLETDKAVRVVIPSTNSPMTLQRYAVFSFLQNMRLKHQNLAFLINFQLFWSLKCEQWDS